MMPWNLDGLLSSMDRLQNFIFKHDIDICYLQKTKLLQKDKNPFISNFSTTCKDWQRDILRREGGLVIFVKSSIHFREIIRSPDDIKQLIEERDNIRQTNSTDLRLT